MNLTRSEQRLFGRFVTVGRGEAAFRAFVPAPLPPALSFDVELVSALRSRSRVK